jgi:hypothetical protein
MLKMLLDPNGGRGKTASLLACACSVLLSSVQAAYPFSICNPEQDGALFPSSSGIVLTNDGHAILREIDVAHPAAKVAAVLSSFCCLHAQLVCVSYPDEQCQRVLVHPAVHDPAQQNTG